MAKAPRINLSGWYRLRWQILIRDKFTCQYCGQGAPDVPLEVDHRIAVADGGTDDQDNLVTACWSCNRGKSGLRQSLALAAARPQRMHKHSIPSPVSETIRDKVLASLKGSDHALAASDIAKVTNVPIASLYVAFGRMKKVGILKLSKGRYSIP